MSETFKIWMDGQVLFQRPFIRVRLETSGPVPTLETHVQCRNDGLDPVRLAEAEQFLRRKGGWRESAVW